MKKIIIILLLLWEGMARAQTIHQLEFFLDTDLGPGNNTFVSVMPGADGSINLTVPMNGRPPGIYQLYFRTKDHNNKWSQLQRKSIEIFPPESQQELARLEYFVDTDAGVGNNNIRNISILPDGSIPVQIPTAGLQPGKHYAYIRLQDALGRWSHSFRQGFELFASASPNQVVAVEYFFQSDPGYTLAPRHQFVTPAQDGSFTLIIPSGLVPQGLDTLMLRVKDSSLHRWSHTVGISQEFSVENCPEPLQPASMANDTVCGAHSKTYTVPEVANASGYWWIVPNGMTIVTGQGSATITLQWDNPLASLTYPVRVAAYNACDTGLTRTFEILVNPQPPVPEISADGPVNICMGDTVVLKSSAGMGNQWFRNGIAIFGARLAEYPVIESGIYRVRVSNNAGCAANSDTLGVAVTAIPPTPTITQENNTLVSSAMSGNQWYRDNVPIAGAINQRYSVTQSGNYSVIASTNGCSSTMSAVITMQITSIPNPPQVSDSIWVYPNPFEDHIQIQSATNSTWLVEIYTVHGKKVLLKRGVTVPYRLPIPYLAPGPYVLRLTNEHSLKPFVRLLIRK